ncbi:hypothetical protein ACIBSV_21335 [Embleya sp. NPDC050154]
MSTTGADKATAELFGVTVTRADTCIARCVAGSGVTLASTFAKLPRPLR